MAPFPEVVFRVRFGTIYFLTARKFIAVVIGFLASCTLRVNLQLPSFIVVVIRV